MTHASEAPLPLFDDIEHLNDHHPKLETRCQSDYQHALSFLQSYRGSRGTFNAYRRETERLLHWSWHLQQKSLCDLRREDIEQYIEFCMHPIPSWIGTKKSTRFIDQEGARLPNPEWRPFNASVSKSQFRKGRRADIKKFVLSQSAIKDMFAILSSFFSFLMQDEYVKSNPVALIRQKSKFVRKQAVAPKIRRLTPLQWEYVLNTAHELAEQNPETHERTLFIMTALYTMYLRISELCASARWTPKMSDFYKDHDNLWWFTTVGKGNKQRQIAVSDAMLQALKRYRQFLGLSALPTPADHSPLIPKVRGTGPIANTTHMRDIVQFCFDASITHLREDSHLEEAEALMEATVHWLRHTGISDDVRRRPREHVRDDAGHSSSATTDKYIDIGLRERHASARKKPVM